MLAADGIVGSAAPGIEGCWLKPNRSAMFTSRLPPSFAPSGANTELHETANAFRNVPPHASPLAFWSVKPLIVAEVSIGNTVAGLDDARLERARGGDHLHRRAGRLERREGDTRERQHLSGVRLHRGDPRVVAAHRGDRGSLDRRADRGRDGVPGLGGAVGQHSRSRQQRAARRAGQLAFEDPLEAVLADLRIGRVPLGGVGGRHRGRDRPERAVDLRSHVRDRRGPVRALRERRPVAGQQRGARCEPHLAAQLLPGSQPREQQRPGETDRGARPARVERYQQRLAKPSEDAGANQHRDRDHAVVVAADVQRHDRRERRRAGGVLVVRNELLLADSLSGRAVEQRVHM